MSPDPNFFDGLPCHLVMFIRYCFYKIFIISSEVGGRVDRNFSLIIVYYSVLCQVTWFIT